MEIQKSFSLSPNERKESENYTGNLLKGRFLGWEIIICGQSVVGALSRIEKMVNRLLLLLLLLLLLSMGFDELAGILLRALIGLFQEISHLLKSEKHPTNQVLFCICSKNQTRLAKRTLALVVIFFIFVFNSVFQTFFLIYLVFSAFLL